MARRLQTAWDICRNVEHEHSEYACAPACWVPMQVVDLLQNGMPLRYDDLSASQAFLRAAAAVNDLTTDLHKHHGAVRDFMREILSSVCLDPPESELCISLTLPAGWTSFAWISYACLLQDHGF